MTILGDSPEEVTPDRGGLDPRDVEYVATGINPNAPQGSRTFYEVGTKDGYVYALGLAEYGALVQAVRALPGVRFDEQTAAGNKLIWRVAPAVEAPAPLFVAPTPIYRARHRNPLTGHYTGGDRGAR